MSEVRDIAADYRKAYLAEYENYKAAGYTDRAAAVADALRALGYEVERAPVKERAIPQEPLETAVDDNAPIKRARAKKAPVKPAE